MEKPSIAPVDELLAPAHWRSVDLVSDLHLHAEDPATFGFFRDWIQSPTEDRADALFILGDLFEVWVGDDILNAAHQSASSGVDDRGFWCCCADLLHAYSQRTPIYFMHGNRDFLLGSAGLARCGMRGISDPTVLVLQGRRYLLSHGDAWCLDDIGYMRFRQMVRQPAWQGEFMARPLDEREAMALELRQQSRAHQSANGLGTAVWADVDAEAACRALSQTGCDTLIHGHTHRPASHDLGANRQRLVLSDWDLGTTPPRAQVMRLDAQGIHRRWPSRIPAA